MRIQTTMTTLSMAMLLSLAMGCTQNADEPIDAAEVANPAAVADPVDPIDAGEPLVGPETEAFDVDDADAERVAGAEAFADWDSDTDGMLSADEFRAGVDVDDWFDDANIDDDNFLSKAEFAGIHAGVVDAPGGIDANGMFATWDADEDGLIDEREFAEGMYVTWDQDRNDRIDNNEYAAGAAWLGW